jgi:hypothetical protein
MNLSPVLNHSCGFVLDLEATMTEFMWLKFNSTGRNESQLMNESLDNLGQTALREGCELILRISRFQKN